MNKLALHSSVVIGSTFYHAVAQFQDGFILEPSNVGREWRFARSYCDFSLTREEERRIVEEYRAEHSKNVKQFIKAA